MVITEQTSSKPTRCPIVALGASTGGVAALTAFFQNLPTPNGIAFVVDLHQPAYRQRRLATVLQQATRLPVTMIEDGMVPQPDVVYVAPPGNKLALVDGVLRVINRVINRGRKERDLLIDFFLHSLAINWGADAAAVILSGTINKSGVDGIAGFQAIKAHGGLTLVQAPTDAEAADLPQQIIATGTVDVIGTAGELARHLAETWRTPTRAAPDATAALAPSAELIGEHAPVENNAEVENSAETINLILAELYTQTGHDLTYYKRSTVLRRIARRLQVNKIDNIADYFKYQVAHPAESQALFKDCLISVTNFFRDPGAFAVLEKEVIAKLLIGKDRSDTIRVWVAGCATGEEAYSVAMLLLEQAAVMEDAPRLQIFATDIDEEAIAFARRGLYPRTISQDISSPRLQRFFIEEKEGFRVKIEVREIVLFAVHNLIKDPPFSRLDLIVCRNLLIYYNQEAQEKSFDIFHYALNPAPARDSAGGGYLFLGTSESADAVPNLFVILDKGHHLFRRRETIVPIPHRLPATYFANTNPKSAGQITRAQETKPRSLEEMYQAWIIRRYAPPRVLVNENYDITHIFGHAERYLRERDGAVTQNIMQKVLPSLRLDLRAALYQAFNKGERTESRLLQVEINGEPQLIQLHVGLIEEPGFPKEYVEVIFEEKKEAALVGLPGADVVMADADLSLISRLEEELLRTRERLQTIIEDHEISNQEIIASNEELQSINEEMKSTTEELETSKEELQSMNEELITVNYELKLKIEELSRANSDLLNLITSTDVGAIFLDMTLRVKRFTPRATELFHLINSDIGRPFAHITHRIYPGVLELRLSELAKRVLTSLETVEEIIQSEDEHWYILRLFPYRTVENLVDGVVLTFVDISDLKRAESELQQRIQQQAVADLGRQALRGATLDVLIGNTTERIAAVLDVDYSGVFRLENDGETLRLQAGVGWQPTMIGWGTVGSESNGQLQFTLYNDAPVVVEDISQEPRFQFSKLLSDHEVVSGITVIIGDRDAPYGVLSAHSRSARVYTSYDVDFLQALANLIAETIARKEAEAQIYFQASLLDAVEQAVIATDLQGEITYWNRFAERLYGWRAEEAIGHNIVEITPSVATAAQAEAMMAQLAKRETWTGEFAVQRRDGSSFTAQVIDSPIYDEDGHQIGIVGVSSDITAYKHAEESVRQSEAFSRALWENNPDLVKLLDLDGNLIGMNSAGLELMEIDSLDPLIGRPWGDFWPDPTLVQSALEAARAGVIGEFQAFRPTAKGTPKWWDVLVTRVPHPGGQQDRLLAVSRDITERKREEEAQRFLANLGEQISRTDETDDMLWTITCAIAEQLQVSRCAFAEVDTLAGQMTVLRDYHLDLHDLAHRVTSVAGTVNMADFGREEIAQLEAGVTIVNCDAATDPRSAAIYATYYQPHAVRAYVIVPIRRENQWVAELWVSSHHARVWTESEIRMLQTVAERGWLALERARTETALRHSEANYRTLVEHAADAIFVSSDDRVYVDANAAACQLSGYTHAELVGKSINDLTPPSDLPRLDSDRRQLTHSGGGQIGEWELLRKDGRRVPIEVSVTQLPDRRWLAFVRDISERKHTEEALRTSEARLRQLADAMPQIVWRSNAQGVVEYLNAQWMYYTGLSYAEGLADANAPIHPDDRAHAVEKWMAAIPEGKPYEYEMRLRRADGVYRWHLARCVPILDEDGNIMHWFGTSTDIDDRKRAEINKEFLNQLSAHTRLLSDPNALMEIAVRMLGTHLQVTQAAFSEIDEATDQFIIQNSWAKNGASFNGIYPISSFSLPTLTAAARTGRTLVIDDTATNVHTADQYSFYRQRGRRAFITVPLTRNGRWLGALAVSSNIARIWHADEIALVETVAAQLWPAIEKARAEAARQRSEEQLRQITDNVPALIAYIDREQRYQFVNAAYETWYELPRAQIIGRSIQELVSARTYTQAQPYIAALLTGEKAPEPISFETETRRQGKPVNFTMRYAPDVAADGQVIGFYALSTDITERKQAEAQLQRNEQRLRLALDVARMEVFEYDVQTGRVARSDNAPALLGLPADDLAFNYFDYIHPEDRVAVRSLMDKLSPQADHYEVEYRFQRPDGATLWVYDRAMAQFDATGHLQRVLGVTQDITSRKLAEIALAESNAILRSVSENTADLIYVKDRAGRLLLANPALLRVLGKSAAAMLGKTDAEYLPDATAAAQIMATDSEIMASGQAAVVEESMQLGAGLRTYLATKSPHLDAEGHVIGLIGISTDITERKRTEESQRLLAYLSEEISRTKDPEELLWTVVCTIGEQLAVERCFFSEVDPANDRVKIGRDYVWGVPSMAGELPLSTFSPEMLATMQAGRTVVNQDTQLDPRTAPFYSAGYAPFAMRAYVTVPLLRNGRWAATLLVSTDQPRIWTEQEVRLLQTVAERTWLALENARLFQQTTELLAQLEAMLDNAPIGFAFFDRDYRYVRINQQLATMHGKPVAEHLGRRFTEIAPLAAEGINPQLEQVLTTGKGLYNVEVHGPSLTDPAQIGYCLASWFPVNIAGETRYIGSMVVDISERKQAEETLRQLTERLEMAQDAAGIGTFEWNIQTNEVQWGTSLEKLYGLAPGSFEGNYENWRQRVYPEDLAPTEVVIAHALQTLTALNYDFRIVHATGDICWMNLQARIFADADGVAVRMVGVNIDITERKRNEEALHASEARYRELADAMPQIVYTALPDGTDDFVNRQWMRYTGLNIDTGLGQAWTSSLHPEDRERTLQRWAEARRTGSLFENEYRLLGADGTYRWHLSRAIPVPDAAGQIVRWIGTSTDIHQHKATEEALTAAAQQQAELLALLEAVLDNAPVGFAFYDRQHRYVRINQTLANINGQPVEAHLGQQISEILPPALNSVIEPYVKQVFTTGEGVYNIESGNRALATGQNVRHFLTSWYPVKTKGEPLYVGAVVVDITERKQAEEALRALNERLEQRVEERTAELLRRNQELDRFAYIASHDLKAPLRAIEHLASWIAEDAGGVLPDKSKDYLGKLHGRIVRMEKLLDDLLAYARIDRQKHLLEFVVLNELVTNIVNLFDPPPHFKIQVQTPMPSLTTARVPLELVLRNLIGNAIKHHNRSDGNVSITATDQGNAIEFSIQDDGPGIAPQFHKRIFQMFQTLKPRDQVEGSGMGLALVKKIVEARGGIIQVESSEGRGATFWFTWLKEL